VEVRLSEEMRRLHSYIHPSTQQDLISKCDVVLIQKHMERMHAEFPQLLKDDKLDGASLVGARPLGIWLALTPQTTTNHRSFLCVCVCVCKNSQDLARTYKLLARIEPGLPPLRSSFEKHVLDEGLNAIAKVTEPALQVCCWWWLFSPSVHMHVPCQASRH